MEKKFNCFHEIISPVKEEKFFRQYWQKKILIVNRRDKNFFDSILTIDDIDHVLANSGIPPAQLNLGKASVGIPKECYSSDYFIRPNDVIKYHRSGNTLFLRSMHLWFKSLRELTNMFAKRFHSPAQANIYLTPAGCHSAYPHWDAHDIFIIQIKGSKKWNIHKQKLKLPLSRYQFDPQKHPVGEKEYEFVLHAGDVAYLPRGFVHQPEALTYSVHIAFGIRVVSLAEIFEDIIVNLSENNNKFREVAPMLKNGQGFNVNECKERMKELITHFLDSENIQATLNKYTGDLLNNLNEDTSGQLMAISNDIQIDLETECFLPQNSTYEFFQNLKNNIFVNGISFSFDVNLKNIIDFMKSTDKFKVRNIPATTDAHRLEIARTLIEKGCIVPIINNTRTL